jgi:predicted nucleic acid-binding protein
MGGGFFETFAPFVADFTAWRRASDAREVLIDYLQGVPEARVELARYRRPHYSIISWMELLCGAAGGEERRVAEDFLGTLTRVELSEGIARRAVELRRTLRLKLPDAIVLASAEEEGCMLVTRNARDFPAMIHAGVFRISFATPGGRASGRGRGGRGWRRAC